MSEQGDSSVTPEIKKKLDELKIQRSTTKGNMTRIKNYIATNKATISAVELDCRVNIFEQYWKLWLSHQTAMERLKPDDAAHETSRSEAEDLYCEVKAIYSTLKQPRQSIADPNTSIVLPSLSKSNLPQVKLPSFSGKYSDYPNFIAIFNKLVGDDDTLSTTEKYNHLRHCLTGPALRTIDSLGKSAENYLTAITTLKQRYDNKCLIFQEHIADLVELSKITKNSASQLRNLIDSVSAHLNAMKALGTETDIMNSLIIYIVSSKLDSESQIKFEDSYDYSSLQKWDDMYKILTKRSQLLEVRESKAHKSTPNTSAQNQSSHHKKKSDYIQSTFSATTNTLCSFCSESTHKIEKCSNFIKLPVLERFSQSKQLSLCINCLRPGHTVKICKSSTCRVCSKKHHSLLHRYKTTRHEANSQPSQLSQPRQFNQPTQYSGYASYIQPKKIVKILNSSNLKSSNINISNKNLLSESENGTITQASSSNSTSLVSSTHDVNTLPADETTEGHVFLATAVIYIIDKTGSYHLARALLDSGSQLNFVTDRLVQLLQLKRHTISGQVIGIGKSSTRVKQGTSITIKSRLNNFSTNINCWILPSITNNHPERKINKTNLEIPTNLELADPTFFKPQKIDLLIGAEKFFDLLSVGQIKLCENGPILQKTIFGWIISGPCKPCSTVKQICASAEVIDNSTDMEQDSKLNQLVEQFWTIENLDTNYCKYNVEHQNCETIFENTIRFAQDNRLMVKLPFKRSAEELGNSWDKVKSRFLWLEKRFKNKPEIKQQYSKFLHEYLTLGHMEEITWKDVSKPHYFIPHQFVIRPDSSTTKFRVVFNASCVTSTNVSLNDILSVGPTVQNDVFAILLKFRCFLYAITADVSKMYRQIWVYPEDRNFQLIIWRDHPGDSLRIYRLKTLTYGTASAPYLATRCLNYLADQYATTYPKAAEIIKSSIYVDDLIAGGDNLAEIQKIQKDVSNIFLTAKLVLRKWYSNETSILNEIPIEEREKPLRFNDVDIIRTLGMIWDPHDDEFRFSVNYDDEIKSSKITKRKVLSELAKLFDPLGLVNPIVVVSKLFLQELWLLKLSWDESLPQYLHDRWAKFKHNLDELKSIRIPRFILSKNSIAITEIHGFCDSSIRAFGACIYIRTIDINGQIVVNLLTAKSKVAPSKKTRTLPVLELLGAELLAKLWSKVEPHFPKQIDSVYFWTDSTIVLGWISAHAAKWQTFVANRVSIIQELTSNVTWKHVNSKFNPADIISRGCTVAELQDSMWFKGPDFLYKPEEFWPTQKTYSCTEQLPEQRKISIRNPPISMICTSTDSILLDSIYNKFNFTKNRRIYAYVHRFISNLKLKIIDQPLQYGVLTADELNHGFIKIVYLIQQVEFKNDIDHLKKHGITHHSGNLKSLNPFIDQRDGLLRVGGRLRNSTLPYTTRCPILLPKNNTFVNSYISFLHFRHCHAGSQALLSIINQQFWIINARDYTRKIVRKCVHCFRYRPKLLNQIMGDLPAERVNAALAFSISGVDFCGPIYTSPSTRAHRIYKTYIAVFVCFISKGVHLEVVTDLSTNAFIAALKRFLSRRMTCKRIYCDNATNFVGARRHLADLREKFLSQSVQSEITTWCAENSITFEHIPPRSPHFGGIWEAAVKSAKSLLYPTLQNSHLTYERLTTVCCQIEAILNSRPITQLSTDPNDERALTPAHFWSQAPSNTFIEPDVKDLNISSLNKWQQISAVQQHFWKRWSNEYISSLQKRTKWQTESSHIFIGKLVLIHEDNLPPQKWLLGRIVNTFTGNDGKVRVADVKTKCGILRRSIHKLALLPID